MTSGERSGPSAVRPREVSDPGVGETGGRVDGVEHLVDQLLLGRRPAGQPEAVPVEPKPTRSRARKRATVGVQKDSSGDYVADERIAAGSGTGRPPGRDAKWVTRGPRITRSNVVFPGAVRADQPGELARLPMRKPTFMGGIWRPDNQTLIPSTVRNRQSPTRFRAPIGYSFTVETWRHGSLQSLDLASIHD